LFAEQGYRVVIVLARGALHKVIPIQVSKTKIGTPGNVC